MTNTPTIVISKTSTFKVVQVRDKVLERCAVKAALADKLTIEELQALINWCNHQEADLWEDMSLQEILNVYRATAEWDTFEAWANEDWKSAYEAWNAAIIDEGNRLEPRVSDEEEPDTSGLVFDHKIEFPNGKGYTPCTKDYFDTYQAQIAHEDVTQEMVDVLYRSYLRENKTARECVLRILNLHDGVKANEEGAHTEATSGQIYAVNNLFLIKGWSATCAIKKILQDMENIRG